MANKYLNDLGWKDDDMIMPNTENFDHIDQDRHRGYMKERKAYGFDARETYCLNTTSVLWLYSHLKRYLDLADEVIYLDNELTRVTIQRVLIDPYIWKVDSIFDAGEYIGLAPSESVTIKEAVNLILEYFKEYLTLEVENHLKVDDTLEDQIKEQIALRKAEQAFRIYAEAFKYMWW